MHWSAKGDEIINSVIKVGFLEKMTFNSKYKGDEEPHQVTLRGKKAFQMGISSKYKGPARGRTWLGCSRSKGASAAEEDDELRGGSTLVEGARPQIVEGLEGCCKNFDFDSE